LWLTWSCSSCYFRCWHYFLCICWCCYSTSCWLFTSSCTLSTFTNSCLFTMLIHSIVCQYCIIRAMYGIFRSCLIRYFGNGSVFMRLEQSKNGFILIIFFETYTSFYHCYSKDLILSKNWDLSSIPSYFHTF
jgi:hypothetical protein